MAPLVDSRKFADRTPYDFRRRAAVVSSARAYPGEALRRWCDALDDGCSLTMTRESPTNLPASVRQRLLNLAKNRGEELQTVLARYGVERLLCRDVSRAVPGEGRG